MRTLLLPFALSTLLSHALAQQPQNPRRLEQLQQQFSAQLQQLAATSPTREQRNELLAKHSAELEQFLTSEAKDTDLWNGRLMAADLQLARGDRAAAATALRRIDAKAAPALLLITAAAMAQHLNLRDLRNEWIEAGTAKECALPDRLAMARLLMTVLREVDRGEGVFTAALAAAKDDEERALIRWHRADGLRDREDLGDNDGFEALEKIATELPNTYWGSVAKDRLRATRLQPGDPAIAFQAKTRQGDTVSLASLRGKTVALVFWSAGDRDMPALLTLLKEQQQRRDENLAVLGVCIDRDERSIAAAVQALGITFPVVGDGKGIETDVALRWFVEGPVVHVIDGEGKVVALGQHAGTADGRSSLLEALNRARK